jgi:N12 class adenine-specific DNA methylase/adenine-specific DNA methylase
MARRFFASPKQAKDGKASYELKPEHPATQKTQTKIAVQQQPAAPPQPGQPTSGEVTANVNWASGTGKSAREYGLDEAASQFSSQLGVDYETARQYLENRQFKEGAFTEDRAKRLQASRQQTTFALDPNAVNELKAVDAQNKERQARYKNFLAYQQANPTEGDSPVSQDIRARISAGLADIDKGHQAIDQENAAYKNWLEETGFNNPEYRGSHQEEFQQDIADTLAQFGSFSDLGKQRTKANEYYKDKPYSQLLGLGPYEKSVAASQLYGRSRLSDEELNNARQLGSRIKGSEILSPTGSFGSQALTTMVADFARMAAGTKRSHLEAITNPLAALASWTLGVPAPSAEDFDNLAKQSEIVGQTAQNDGVVFKISGVAGQGLGGLPGLVLATTAAGGNPILGFGVHAALTNTDRPAAEQADAITKDLLLGSVFSGIGALGRFAGSAASRRFLTPEVIRALNTPESEKSFLGSIVEKGRKINALAENGATEGEKNAAQQTLDRFLEKHGLTVDDLSADAKPAMNPILKTAMRRAELAKTLAEKGTSIGLVAAAGYTSSRLSGQSNEESLKNALLWGAMEAVLGIRGKKQGDVWTADDIAAANERVVRVPDEKGKPRDILLLDNNGKLEGTDVTNNIPRDAVDAQILPKPGETSIKPADAGTPGPPKGVLAGDTKTAEQRANEFAGVDAIRDQAAPTAAADPLDAYIDKIKEQPVDEANPPVPSQPAQVATEDVLPENQVSTPSAPVTATRPESTPTEDEAAAKPNAVAPSTQPRGPMKVQGIQLNQRGGSAPEEPAAAPAPTKKPNPKADFLADPDAGRKLQDLLKEESRTGLHQLAKIGEKFGLSEKEVDKLYLDAKRRHEKQQRQTRTENIVREERKPKGRVSEGSETSIEIPDSGKSYKGRYVVRELSDLVPSHNPQTFQPNPDYYFVNDRHYDKEQQYQQQVIDRSKAENFKPNLVINDSPTVETGPPVIDAEGNVLGGNSRTMIISRAYEGGNLSYREHLVDNAERYGLDINRIGSMKAPVLVRQISDSNFAPQEAITDLNKTSTTDLTTKEKSIAEAAKLSDESVDFITGQVEKTGDDASLMDALNARGVEIVNHLIEQKVFGNGERNTLIDDGKITEDGKKRIERLLLGRVFEDLEQLELTSPAIKNALTRIISPLMKVNQDPDWNIAEPLRDAIDLINEARATGQGTDLDTFAANINFLRPQGWSDASLGLAKTLSSGLRKATAAFKQYADDMRLSLHNEGAMFDMGAKSQPEAFESAFGTAPEEKAATTKAAPAPVALPGEKPKPSTSDLFDQALGELRGEQDKPAKEKDEYDDIADIMGFEPATLKHALNNGPEFEPEKYGRLKPVFEKAISKIDAETPADQMKQFLKNLNERFTLDQIAALKPYVVQYVDDQAKILPKSFTHDGITIEIKPLDNLTPENAEIQDKTIRDVLADPQKWLDAYDRHKDSNGGKEINSDVAKELFDEYTFDPLARVSAVHEASSMIAALAFRQKLRDLPKGSKVLYLAGGGGSGKGFALKNVITEAHDLVFDGVMKSVDGNKDVITLAREHGHSPRIVAVITPAPVAAVQNVRRSISSRRLVPADPIIKGHSGFRAAFVGPTYDFAQEHGIPIRFLKNDGAAHPSEISFDEFKELVYSEDGQVEGLIRDASYAEIGRGEFKGRPFDARLREAFDGLQIPAVDTRREGDSEGRSGRTAPENGRRDSEGQPGTSGLADVRTDTNNRNEDSALGVAEPGIAGNGNAASDLGSGRARPTTKPGTLGESAAADAGSDAATGHGAGSKSVAGESTPSDLRDTSDGGTAPARSNFRVTNELDFARFSPKTRYQKNVAALKLIQKLDEEGRQATPEEQSILAQYVGWGGLKQVFDPKNTDWAKEHAELKELLPQEEYEKARRSVLNAHYTSKPVVDAVWSAVRRFGFDRGSVLEPSMGTGNFFGLMPAALRGGTQLTGVELEPLTSKIAKHLYPNAQIFGQTGFQDVFIAPGSVDLAIGNPPFGDDKVFDKTSKELSKLRIHAYFFAKSIDSLRPGGVLAMVVSKGFLDSRAPEAQAARDYIAKKAKLIGAIRLPNTAFMANANTEVTTDIVFLQRKENDADKQYNDWTAIGTVTDPKTGDPIHINKYFAERPEMMLGTMTLEGSMYRANEPTLKPRENQDLELDLANAIDNLPENIITNRTDEKTDDLIAAAEKHDLSEYHGLRPYNFGAGKDGKIFQLVADQNGRVSELPLNLGEAGTQRAKGMIGIRGTIRQILRLESDENTTDDELKPHRAQLNEQYDAFVKKHGFISSDANKRVFREDADYPLLAALEKNYDRGISREVAKKEGVEPRQPTAEKADIFTKRTVSPVRPITKVDNATDALIASMNNRGRLDLGYMSELYNKPAAEIIKELGPRVYNDPTKQAWVTDDEYLSGDVKTKLEEAKVAALESSEYARNVDALEKVIPADIPPVDIFVKFGSPWVPLDVYQQFVSETLEGQMSGSYNPTLGKFVGVNITSRNKTLNEQTFGVTDDKNIVRTTGAKIKGGLLNNKNPVIKVAKRDSNGEVVVNDKGDAVMVPDPDLTAAAQGKAETIIDLFADWIWKDQARRQRLAALYNERFNRRVLRKFDGQHLQLPGISGAITLRPHIQNFVYRVLQHGKVLADHVVGAGKTPAAIIAGMEMRRLGMAKKPMYVVPNHLVEQWSQEFKKFYPGANILAATRKDFKKQNRQKLFAKIATGDWDAVVVAHSSFQFIPVPVDVEREFIREQMSEMQQAIDEARRAAGKKDRSVRDMEKALTKLDSKFKRLNDVRRDDLLNFAEMGVDALFLDEAHEYKNLFFTTQKQGVGSLGNPQGSQKAFDMFMKTQMILRKNNDRNVVFLTGTPVSNSLSEIFHMQRYLQNDTLKKQGINSFDAWANTFGQDTQDWELDASGRFRQKLRFVKFANLPELRQLWQEVADTVSNADIKKAALEAGEPFKLPKIKRVKVIAERSPEQAEFIGLPIEETDHEGNPVLDPETGIPKVDYRPERSSTGWNIGRRFRRTKTRRKTFSGSPTTPARPGWTSA